MPKLNQLIAIEKGGKTRINEEITRVYHAVQKPAMMAGIARVYRPKMEDGEVFPAESTKVQSTATEMLSETARLMTELWDLTYTKDMANTGASADVKLPDGTVLAQKVPVTHLLFLEKQLTDLHTIFKKIPVLDPSEDWHWDSNANCFATTPTQNFKTKKVPKNHVKAEATDKHPAQVDVYHEDVVIGTWTTIKFSGALPAERLATLLDRVTILLNAVKAAREEANMIEAPNKGISKKMFEYLYGDGEHQKRTPA